VKTKRKGMDDAPPRRPSVEDAIAHLRAAAQPGWHHGPAALALIDEVQRQHAETARLIGEAETSRIAIRTLKDKIARLEAQIEGRAVHARPGEVKRREDMSARGFMRVIIQDDGDAIVAVHEERDGLVQPGSSAEFCVPSTGGGHSPKTWNALRALYVAMLEDEKEDAARGGAHGSEKAEAQAAKKRGES
jgi:hypothetical protein